MCWYGGTCISRSVERDPAERKRNQERDERSREEPAGRGSDSGGINQRKSVTRRAVGSRPGTSVGAAIGTTIGIGATVRAAVTEAGAAIATTVSRTVRAAVTGLTVRAAVTETGAAVATTVGRTVGPAVAARTLRAVAAGLGRAGRTVGTVVSVEAHEYSPRRDHSADRPPGCHASESRSDRLARPPIFSEYQTSG